MISLPKCLGGLQRHVCVLKLLYHTKILMIFESFHASTNTAVKYAKAEAVHYAVLYLPGPLQRLRFVTFSSRNNKKDIGSISGGPQRCLKV